MDAWEFDHERKTWEIILAPYLSLALSEEQRGNHRWAEDYLEMAIYVEQELIMQQLDRDTMPYT